MRIARVIPLLRLPRGLHFFDYTIPDTLQGVRVGALVRIPFRAQKIDGVVIAILRSCVMQERIVVNFP